MYIRHLKQKTIKIIGNYSKLALQVCEFYFWFGLISFWMKNNTEIGVEDVRCYTILVTNYQWMGAAFWLEILMRAITIISIGKSHSLFTRRDELVANISGTIYGRILCVSFHIHCFIIYSIFFLNDLPKIRNDKHQIKSYKKHHHKIRQLEKGDGTTIAQLPRSWDAVRFDSKKKTFDAAHLQRTIL